MATAAESPISPFFGAPSENGAGLFDPTSAGSASAEAPIPPRGASHAALMYSAGSAGPFPPPLQPQQQLQLQLPPLPASSSAPGGGSFAPPIPPMPGPNGPSSGSGVGQSSSGGAGMNGGSQLNGQSSSGGAANGNGSSSGGNPSMEPYRSNWLALLDNGIATDTVLVCGQEPDIVEIPCHRAVLLAQSAHFRNRALARLGGGTNNGGATNALPLPNLPSRIDLPDDIPPQAVRVFLRYLYSGVPQAMDCSSDPVVAVDTLHAIEHFASEESDISRWRAARRAVESQLIESMGSEAAGKALARMNRYGMRGTFEACLPIYMQAARSDPTRVLGLLEGMDFGNFIPAVRDADWPGGEMQKFRICRAWAEINRATPEQKAEIARLIDLEKITLDDLEKEVEPSGLIPIQKLTRQYTAVARRLRAQSGLPGNQVSLRQQILGPTQSAPELVGTSGSVVGAPGPAQPIQTGPLPPQAILMGPPGPMTGPNGFPGLVPMMPPGGIPPNAVGQPMPLGQLPSGQPVLLNPMPMGVPQQQMPPIIIPPSSNGLLNNGQPMNLVSLGNGTTAVVGSNGVVMNSLPPGSVTLAAASNAVVPANQQAAAAVQTDVAPAPAPAPAPAQTRSTPAQRSSRRSRDVQASRDLALDEIPAAPAAPVLPNGGGDISAGFEQWVVPRGDVQATRQHIIFQSDQPRSCRSAVGLSRGQWRWVIMIERAGPRPTSASGSYLPDIGIMIGDTFDPRANLRSQPNCCAWDGRDSICVNSMPIPYPRSRGGPLRDGEVIVVDLDLDNRTLGFRRNGVDCGTSIRGFPGNVFLAVAGRYPCRIRWVGLSHVA